MDVLWKRELAEAKLLCKKPSNKKRLIVEGYSDKWLLQKLLGSENYNIQSLTPGSYKNNKFSVIEAVYKSVKSDETPPTMGLVDMDGDIDGAQLKSIFETLDCKTLSEYVKDSRNETCVFSLVSKLIFGDWKWIKSLFKNQLIPNSWEEEWPLVLKISMFRTHIHMIKQRNEVPPPDLPKLAVKFTKSSSNEFGFEEWMSLFSTSKKNFNRKDVNDHCLEATICDYIRFYTGSYHYNINTLRLDVSKLLLWNLKEKIHEYGFPISKLINHTGSPFTP